MEKLHYWMTWLGDQLYLLMSLFSPDAELVEDSTTPHWREADRPYFHPASGLPMVGSFDVDGNPYL